MFEKILEGVKPSVLFRQMLQDDTQLSKRDIGYFLREEFPDIDGVVVQLVWGWEGPGAIRSGLSDENLDAHIFALFAQAGYVRPDGLESSSAT